MTTGELRLRWTNLVTPIPPGRQTGIMGGDVNPTEDRFDSFHPNVHVGCTCRIADVSSALWTCEIYLVMFGVRIVKF